MLKEAGGSTSLYTGHLSFSHTDVERAQKVSIP